MCVCVCERDRHTDRQRECICEYVYVGACVCVCARVRARVCVRMRVCTLAPNLDEATSHINYLIIKLNLQNKQSTTSRALFATIERTLFFFLIIYPPFFFFQPFFFFFKLCRYFHPNRSIQAASSHEKHTGISRLLSKQRCKV